MKTLIVALVLMAAGGKTGDGMEWSGWVGGG